MKLLLPLSILPVLLLILGCNQTGRSETAAGKTNQEFVDRSELSNADLLDLQKSMMAAADSTWVPTDVRVASASKARRTRASSPSLDELLKEKPEDSCDAFYNPRANLRVFKTLPAKDPCEARGTSLLAFTDIQVLFLCEDGKSIGNYDFAMGRGGADKRADNDLRTPLGTYPISSPKSSGDGFRLFIPVGYPTPEQVLQGFTGDSIGIHGPAREFRCAGFLNTTVNWTRGCLAVASDRFILEIGRFVASKQVKEITILPSSKTP